MFAAILVFFNIVVTVYSESPINLPDSPDNDVVQYSGYLDFDNNQVHYMYELYSSNVII